MDRNLASYKIIVLKVLGLTNTLAYYTMVLFTGLKEWYRAGYLESIRTNPQIVRQNFENRKRSSFSRPQRHCQEKPGCKRFRLTRNSLKSLRMTNALAYYGRSAIIKGKKFYNTSSSGLSLGNDDPGDSTTKLFRERDDRQNPGHRRRQRRRRRRWPDVSRSNFCLFKKFDIRLDKR